MIVLKCFKTPGIAHQLFYCKQRKLHGLHVGHFSCKLIVFLCSFSSQCPSKMLSFFRKNTITDGELAKISRQYTNLNEEIQIAEDASTLLDLGYSSPTELKETIYGELHHLLLSILF